MTEEEIKAWIRRDIVDETIEENKFKTLDDIIAKFVELQEEFPYINHGGEITNFIRGVALVNTHAVNVVVESLLKLIERVDIALKSLNEKNKKANRRKILLTAFKLATFFDFLYSAMVSNPDEIFWSRERSQKIVDMMEHYTYEVPIDIDGHDLETTERLENFDYIVAVASKGLESPSFVKQVFNAVRFGFKYKNDKVKTADQAKFFMTVFKEDNIMRMMKFSDQSFVKAQAKKGLQKIELEKKIYIPMVEEDMITLDNLDDASYPRMLQEDMDLPCKFTKSKFDMNKNVKIRILYN